MRHTHAPGHRGRRRGHAGPALRRAALAGLAIAIAAPAPAVLAQSRTSGASAQSDGVHLTLDRYDALRRDAAAQTGPSASWTHGSIQAYVRAEGGTRTLEVTITADLVVPGRGHGAVPLLPSDVVLSGATVDGSPAALVRSGGWHAFHVPQLDADARVDSRTFSLRLTLAVPVLEPSAGALQAVVPLPPLPGARVQATLDDGADSAELWPAARVVRRGDTLEATLGTASAFALRWGTDAGAQAVRRVSYTVRPDATGDGVDVVAVYEVAPGAERVDVRLVDEDTALVDVSVGGRPAVARTVRGWHVATLDSSASGELTARFRLAIDRSQGQPELHLPLTRVPMTQVNVEVPGERDVRLSPGVPVRTEVVGEGEAARTVAVGHLPPSDGVTIQWTESRAAPEEIVRVNTETFQVATLDEGVLASKVRVGYEVIRGKVKELALELPEGVVLYRVHGDGLEDWRTFSATDEAPRQVRVFLGRELSGAYTLELELETIVPKAEGSELTIPVVRPLGAFRERGVVALVDGGKVGFAEATPAGYSKVGEDALPAPIRQGIRGTIGQAFKHVGEPSGIASAVAQAREGEVRFAARTDTLYEVTDGALRALSTVLLEVKSGRRDAFVLTLPERVAEPIITAPSLHKAERLEGDALAGIELPGGVKAYEVKFTQALEGAVTLDVEVEQLLPKELGTLTLPALRVLGAESEQGSFGLVAETGIEVLPGDAPDLRKVEANELPKSVRLRSTGDLQAGYQYAYAGWSLDLEVKRHKTVETRSAVATQAWLETTVLETGHVETRVIYAVANQDRQFLRVTPPDGAEVLRVAAGGRSVKAVEDEETGAVAIPLPRDRTVMVELTYSQSLGELGLLGSAGLEAPTTDLRVSDVQWHVVTPGSLGIYGVETTLSEVPSYEYRTPPEPGLDGEVPIAVPQPRDARWHLYTYAVQDEGQPALTLSMRFLKTPGEGAQTGLLLLALLGLGLALWRRAGGEPVRASGAIALVLGGAAGALHVAVWGLDTRVGMLVLLGFVTVAFVRWLVARRRQSATATAVGAELSQEAP